MKKLLLMAVLCCAALPAFAMNGDLTNMTYDQVDSTLRADLPRGTPMEQVKSYFDQLHLEPTYVQQPPELVYSLRDPSKPYDMRTAVKTIDITIAFDQSNRLQTIIVKPGFK